ncbi:MAG: acyl-[acyl-carrier-protein] thioesterase [Burkholderiales bacterium]|nr:acyl-[acyl-carrier-protein] thioesterase [Burkholderiales bacterium]
MTTGKTFTLRQKIRFSHCDPAGILYFAHVFDMVNATVEDWFELGLGMPFDAFHQEHGYGNPVVSTHCEFLHPCRFGEELAFALAPTRVGRSSIDLRIVAIVAGEERIRLRHRTAMVSLDTFRPIAIPDALRARAEEYLADPASGSVAKVATIPAGAPLPNAFRSRQLIRYSHCDPGGIVYFARFFDLFNAALEDWFAAGLASPWAEDFMGPRNLRAPSLLIGCEFRRGCRLGEALDIDLWVTRIGRDVIELALAGSVAGEERMHGAWTLGIVSHETMQAVPIPEDLRPRLARFAAPGA